MRIPIRHQDPKSSSLLDRAVRCVLRGMRSPAGASLLVAGIALSPAAQAQSPFPALVELSSLLPPNGGDGSAGVVFFGTGPDQVAGSSVSGAGDVNGDGIDDLLIGAPCSDLFYGSCLGEAYVVFGRSSGFSPTFQLRSLLPENGGDGSNGFVIRGIGIDPPSHAGAAVKAGGDINGDGFDDLTLGDWAANDWSGEAYVIFGRDVGQAGNFPAVIELSSLLPQNGGDGSVGFVLNDAGVPGNNKRLGYSVSGAGDVNNDGIDDLIIDSSGAQSAYVVYGRDTDDMGHFPALFTLANLLPANGGDGDEGFVLTEIDNTRYGAVAGAGDVSGDGVDDLLVGAPFPYPMYGGKVYVLFGRDAQQDGRFPAEFKVTRLLDQYGGDGSRGFVAFAECCVSYAGASVSSGDVNGDGLSDVLIGSLEHAYSTTYVLLGRDMTQGDRFPPEYPLTVLDAPDADGSEGFIVEGFEAFASTSEVSVAGDVDSDGIDDVLVGVWDASPDDRDSAGQSFLIFGHDAARVGNFAPELPLEDLLPENGGDGSSGVVFNGIDVQDHAGFAVGAAGDFNGDGIDDLVIGAPNGHNGPLTRAGQAYVVFGREVDGDGVPGAVDNCTLEANTDQRDTDGDGIGNRCDADLNNDCLVNFPDLGELKLAFLTADPEADLDGDGAVNFGDLGIMKEAFFLPPGPSGIANICKPERAHLTYTRP